MAGYRRFTKTDWYSMAGSEAFLDGSQPFIYERGYNGDNGNAGIVIVVDKNGIQVQLFGDSTGEDNIWLKETHFTAMRAEGYLKKLIEFTEKFNNPEDLSYELDHPTEEVVKGFEFC